MRIAESVDGVGEGEVSQRSTGMATRSTGKSTYETEYLDSLGQNGVNGMSGEAEITAREKGLVDGVGESLARLGRVKRVGLGVKEKKEFVRMWTKTRRTW